MTKKYEVEVKRANITPRQFFTYCKNQLAKKGITLNDWIDFNNWKNPIAPEKGYTIIHDNGGKEQKEIIKLMPYEMQLYLQDDYNIIIEFDFYDDKTGFGYLYIIEYDTEEKEEKEEKTMKKTLNYRKFLVKTDISSDDVSYNDFLRYVLPMYNKVNLNRDDFCSEIYFAFHRQVLTPFGDMIRGTADGGMYDFWCGFERDTKYADALKGKQLLITGFLKDLTTLFQYNIKNETEASNND